MTTFHQRIYLSLLLCLCGNACLTWGQTGARLTLPPVLKAWIHLSENRIASTFFRPEYCAPDHSAARLAARFQNALQNDRLTAPARHNALFYWGQYPDTSWRQQAEKNELRAAWQKAMLKVDATAESSAGKQIIFVHPQGTGAGSSWRNALSDLQKALAQARAGQEIWVAAGEYHPTDGHDRQASFVIPDSVRLYGGFAGFETSKHQRDWQKNLTILSGEIGGEEKADNSYSVVATQNVGSTTLLDGFVITGGYADGVQDLGDPQRCGGGWFNNASGGISNPTIVNCLFAHNYARDGGGFYNFSGQGQANPSFINCQFVSNQADLDGGGLFVDSRGGEAEVIIEHCFFSNNRANFGAAISNLSEGGKTNIRIDNSVFELNVAFVRKVIHNGNRTAEGEEREFFLIQRASRLADNKSVVGEDENTAGQSGQMRTLQRGEIAFLNF